jgi:hypothetical protein
VNRAWTASRSDVGVVRHYDIEAAAAAIALYVRKRRFFLRNARRLFRLIDNPAAAPSKSRR